MVTVTGILDEHTDWRELSGLQAASITLDLEGVRRITSYGVQGFMAACRLLPPTTRVQWIRASVPMVLQLGMIANFAGRAVVRTYLAPYWCPSCREERAIELDGGVALAAAPPALCERCGGRLEFEDASADYFAWTLEGHATSP